MFADPEKILRDFGIGENMIIADLGAGSGFYTIAAAKMASGGKVYAIEVQKDFVTTLKLKTEHEHVNNVEAIWGDIEKIGGTKIADRVVDVVIISNVLFMAEDRKTILKEAYRILKLGGRVLFIDWSDASALGPKPGAVFLSAQARAMFEAEKFTFDQNIDAGAHHYGMIFKKI